MIELRCACEYKCVCVTAHMVMEQVQIFLCFKYNSTVIVCYSYDQRCNSANEEAANTHEHAHTRNTKKFILQVILMVCIIKISRKMTNKNTRYEHTHNENDFNWPARSYVWVKTFGN